MSIADEINAISDKVLALEQENESLRQQLASSGNTEAYDKLIDLLTEDIEWQERHMTDRTSPKMKSIVEAYRAVRPK
jgi:ketosteroid isomerase-like protein